MEPKFLMVSTFVAQLVKNSPAMRETWVQSLGWEDPLEKWNATHSSILTWRILQWTIEYYPAIKKNESESVLVRWMNLEPVIQSEVSQKEKNSRMRRIRNSIGLKFLNTWSVHALLEWCYLTKDLRRQVRGSLEKGIRSPNKGFCP